MSNARLPACGSTQGLLRSGAESTGDLDAVQAGRVQVGSEATDHKVDATSGQMVALRSTYYGRYYVCGQTSVWEVPETPCSLTIHPFFQQCDLLMDCIGS